MSRSSSQAANRVSGTDRRGHAWHPTLIVLLLAVALPLAVPGCAKRPPRAHDLVFQDINPRSDTHGLTLALSDLYAERGIVLQFTASWCKFCREEMPSLQQTYAEGETPIVFVAADEGPYRENILIVAERAGLTAPLLYVPDDRAESVGKHYRYDVIPATYFIDAAGRIHGSHQGEMTAEEMGLRFRTLPSAGPESPPR